MALTERNLVGWRCLAWLYNRAGEFRCFEVSEKDYALIGSTQTAFTPEEEAEIAKRAAEFGFIEVCNAPTHPELPREYWSCQRVEAGTPVFDTDTGFLKPGDFYAGMGTVEGLAAMAKTRDDKMLFGDAAIAEAAK